MSILQQQQQTHVNNRKKTRHQQKQIVNVGCDTHDLRQWNPLACLS